MFTYFHQIWHVATAVNAEQCALKLCTTSGIVYTHYLVSCNVMKQKCDKNSVISRKFQQKNSRFKTKQYYLSVVVIDNLSTLLK